MPFACSICEQESQKICAFCTKDACDNHLCERCGCCSDCCECEVPLDENIPAPQHLGPSEPEPGNSSEPEAFASEPAPASEPPTQLNSDFSAVETSASSPPEIPEP